MSTTTSTFRLADLCVTRGHDLAADGWRLCACGRSLPDHTNTPPDPAGGNGCGMTWRVCSRCEHIDEHHITEHDPNEHEQDRTDDMVTVRIIHSTIETAGHRVTTTIFRSVDPEVARYVRDQVAAGRGININDGACVIPADAIRDFQIHNDRAETGAAEQDQPGGNLRQDVSAGPALPNHHQAAKETTIVEPSTAGGDRR